MNRLDGMGEDALIARLVGLVPTGAGLEGPGDDCAVADEGGAYLRLLKTDALVEGVHFVTGDKARRVGWKAVARVVSDFAAMGGLPERLLATLALPAETELQWVEDVYRGMGDCLKEFGAVMVGGETCRVPQGSAAVISISGTGRVERDSLVTRSGGNAGDGIWVTGTLGGSLRGKHLDFMPRVVQARWLVEHFKPTAMMDLSDGLARDLPRLAGASGCGFVLDRAMIPVTGGHTLEQALEDGEDFELLFTIPESEGFEIGWERIFPGLRLSRIGRLVGFGNGEGISGGWDHFGT